MFIWAFSLLKIVYNDICNRSKILVKRICSFLVITMAIYVFFIIVGFIVGKWFYYIPCCLGLVCRFLNQGIIMHSLSSPYNRRQNFTVFFIMQSMSWVSTISLLNIEIALSTTGNSNPSRYPTIRFGGIFADYN